LQQVLFPAVFTHVQRYCNSVFFDDFVCSFTADARAHSGHEIQGGCQKWQAAFQLTVDHRWECTELIQHGEEGFKLSVNSEECIWQRHAANHGAEHVAFIPLLASQVCNHREVSTQNNLQAADAFARTRIHLVRHCGRANLAFLEAFGNGLITSHQADGG